MKYGRIDNLKDTAKRSVLCTAKGAPPVTVLTDEHGGFTLTMPPGLLLPSNGIQLTAHGANGNAQVTIAASEVASNGLVGAVTADSAGRTSRQYPASAEEHHAG